MNSASVYPRLLFQQDVQITHNSAHLPLRTSEEQSEGAMFSFGEGGHLRFNQDSYL